MKGAVIYVTLTGDIIRIVQNVHDWVEGGKPMTSGGSKFNLQEMQQYFEEQADSIRIISDLSLSVNDYRSLGTKLKSLCFFTGSEDDIQDMMLSVVVYCTYSLVYMSQETNFDEIFGVILSDSQYLERLHLKIYDETFLNYGLNRFGYDDKDIKVRCIKLTARHAGIPDDEKNIFFDLICNDLECQDVKRMEKEIFEALPYKTKFIFSNLDQDTRQQMIIETRNLIYDIRQGEGSRDRLLCRYPEMSVSLIDHALYWAENLRMKVKFNM